MTKEYLDLRLQATANEVRIEFRDQTTRMIRWFVPTAFAGMMVASGLVATILALLA